MRTLFLTSEIGTSIKINGERKPCKLENVNNFLINFKNSITKHMVALFFASTPASFETNDQYASYIQTSFAMSGIQFEHNYVVDDRTTNIADLIAKADLIYLMGGRTLAQSAFFDRIKLRTMLKDYNGVVIGESAGAINMADNAYESREDLADKSHWYKGLGLTKYNIEPHFSEKNMDLIDLTLKPDSCKSSFIALENRSYIMVKENIATLYGNAWLFSNGDYRLINKINEQQKLD